MVTALVVPHNNTLSFYLSTYIVSPAAPIDLFFFFFGLVLISPARESFEIEKKMML